MSLIAAPAASDEEINRAHTAEYLRRVQNGELTEKELRRIGFPWSPADGGTFAPIERGDDCGGAGGIARGQWP